MAYVPTGFTPEQEAEILSAHKRHEDKLDELTASARRTETLRTITVIATVGGFVYTLARVGELIAAFREKRRAKREGADGVRW